ncbi:MAG TPA: hypothetical protein VK850_14735, partial [Candidatus Binatia bacterium]|nr:hypothetical protein [Candidatus Binatia bacterium]
MDHFQAGSDSRKDALTDHKGGAIHINITLVERTEGEVIEERSAVLDANGCPAVAFDVRVGDPRF